MAKMHEAQVVLVGRSERRVVAAYEAISPEATKMTGGMRVAPSMRDGTLFLHFEADTIPALRALVNSYLRWLSMIEDVLDMIEKKPT
jgi:tRNA threonylcarbamoyladenosine modification (KEOPS) complex  Pcc1 subunit